MYGKSYLEMGKIDLRVLLLDIDISLNIYWT